VRRPTLDACIRTPEAAGACVLWCCGACAPRCQPVLLYADRHCAPALATVAERAAARAARWADALDEAEVALAERAPLDALHAVRRADKLVPRLAAAPPADASPLAHLALGARAARLGSRAVRVAHAAAHSLWRRAAALRGVGSFRAPTQRRTGAAARGVWQRDHAPVRSHWL
jgi:hypothetical protein